MAKIVLGFENEDKDLQKAQSDNASVIAGIIQSLKSIGILEEDIQTINFNVYPMYDFIDGRQVFRGYRVEHMLQITDASINNVGIIVDTAVKAGANRVSNISFHLSNPRAAYREALNLAVKDSIQNAQTIARNLQVELIKTPGKITEITNSNLGPIPFIESQMVKTTATDILPGKQEIIALVTSVFSTI